VTTASSSHFPFAASLDADRERKKIEGNFINYLVNVRLFARHFHFFIFLMCRGDAKKAEKRKAVRRSVPVCDLIAVSVDKEHRPPPVYQH
jgi:hypothetical protein